MPSLKTNYYSGLKQACKDCPHLVVEPDGVHVNCYPPMGECPEDYVSVERDSDGFHCVRDEGLSEP